MHTHAGKVVHGQAVQDDGLRVKGDKGLDGSHRQQAGPDPMQAIKAVGPLQGASSEHYTHGLGSGEGAGAAAQVSASSSSGVPKGGTGDGGGMRGADVWKGGVGVQQQDMRSGHTAPFGGAAADQAEQQQRIAYSPRVQVGHLACKRGQQLLLCSVCVFPRSSAL